MSNLWLPVLEKLPLSRAEQAAVKRYEQDPLGRGFLPVADILRSHKRIDESLEILTQGVERHPTFTVARVVLARELLIKGLVLQSWQTLADSPQSLDDNVLAQKLRFKLSVLIGNTKIAKETFHHLQKHQMADKDILDLGEMLNFSGMDRVRERLILDYRASGTELNLPTSDELDLLAPPSHDEVDQDEHSEPFPAVDDAQIETFQVLPLSEIFHGSDTNFKEATGSGLELDSTTLAELYCKQGHYSKAMSIYRRLLRMTPNSDYLRRKVKEIALLERDQKSDDLTVDPSVVDQMEALEIIDSQTKLFESILERLERQNE